MVIVRLQAVHPLRVALRSIMVLYRQENQPASSGPPGKWASTAQTTVL